MKQRDLYSKLTGLGYDNLLPIIPRDAKLSDYSKLDADKLGKIPGKQIGDGWVGFSKWTQHQTSEEDIQEWSEWHDHPVGILANNFPGIDVDVDDPGLVQKIVEVLDEHLPETAERSREGSARIVRSYKLALGEKVDGVQRVIYAVDGKPAGMVEILGPKHQYLLEGEHKSGSYQTLTGRPALVTVKQIQAAVEALKKIDGFVESTKSQGTRLRSVRTEHEAGPMSYNTKISIVKAWRPDSGRHDALRDIIHIKVKLGIDVAKRDALELLESIPRDMRDTRWQDEYDDISRLAKGSDSLLKMDIYIPEPMVEMEIPDFPNIRLPEPLELQHEEFRRVTFDPQDDLMFPFESSFSGYILNGKVLTPCNGRMPVLHNMGLGSSTAGKDLNSTDIYHKFKYQRYGKDIVGAEISNMIDVPGIITSDTSLLEELHSDKRKRGLLLLVTEAGDNMKRLCSKGSNDSVAALGKMIRHNYDGLRLPGNVKVKSKDVKPIDGIDYANLYLAWYAQPEIFFPTLTTDMLSDGFAGRNDYTYYVHDGEIRSMFGESSGTDDYFSQEYVDYFTFVYIWCTKNDFSSKIRVTLEPNDTLRDWEQSLVRDDKDLQKFIRRIPMSAEKYLTIWAAHEHLWECFKTGQEPWRKKLKFPHHMVDNIMPWCEYQRKLRENVIFGRIGESLWKLREDYVVHIITDAVNHPAKIESQKGQDIAKQGKVSRRHILNYLKEKTSLNLGDGANRIKLLDNMVREGRLIKGDSPIDWYALKMEE